MSGVYQESLFFGCGDLFIAPVKGLVGLGLLLKGLGLGLFHISESDLTFLSTEPSFESYNKSS